MKAEPVGSAAADAVLRLLTARTGLVFPDSRREPAEKSVRQVMRKAGFGSLAAYAQALEEGRTPLDDVVDEVTVGETYFFRERPHFDFIRQEVLPPFRRSHPPEQKIRVWSAGCASGEEAYSMAILLEEEGLASRSRVLATDLSGRALERARQARFGRWSLRGCDDAFIARYFLEDGNRLVLAERIRSAVVFEVLNLALDVYPSAANGTAMTDLILCRNVLIYLDRETIRVVARGLFDSLVPGGWLITGPSDPPLSGYVPFEPVMTPAGVLYRRPAAEDARRDVQFSAMTRSTIAAPVSAGPRSAPPAPATFADQAKIAFTPASFTGMSEGTNPVHETTGEAVLRLRSLANTTKPETAARAALDTIKQHPLSAEVHFVTASLMIALGRDAEAAAFLRKAIYLDRSAALAHFLLASVLQRSGDLGGARRSYRNALRAASGQPAEERLPLSDGETYGRLAEATLSHLRLLSVATADEEKPA